MAITLYQYPGGHGVGSVSPPCLRVDMALRWLGLEFERRDLRGGADKVSQTGRLPVLEIDGERFVDSTRILDELECRFDVPWKVDSDSEATHLRLWEYTVNECFYWLGFAMRWVDEDGRKRFLDVLLAKAGPLTRFLVHRVGARQRIKRAQRHGVGYRDRVDILAEIERGLDLLATDLGEGPFLLGRDRASRADLTVTSLFAQVGFGNAMPEVMRMIEQRPTIRPYLKRVCELVGGDQPRWLT
jgi:glutathione S-transferase